MTNAPDKRKTDRYVVTDGNEALVYDAHSGWHIKMYVDGVFPPTVFSYDKAVKQLDDLPSTWYIAQVVYEPVPGSRMTPDEARAIVLENIKSWNADTFGMSDDDLLKHYANIVSIEKVPGALVYEPTGDFRVDHAWKIFLEGPVK